MNLPNKLTLLRVAMIPLFILCFYLPIPGANAVALAIFILAYATDMLDGYLARKRDLVTDFGKLMDPMADKMLTAAAMIMLNTTGVVSPVATIVVIGREFIISGFRLVAASDGVVIAASKWGKAKTMSQFIAIVLLLLHDSVIGLCGFPLDQVVLWVSVALTVISAVDYVVKNKDCIKSY